MDERGVGDHRIDDVARGDESALIRAVLLAIGARPDLRVWRQNVGVARMPSGRIVRFGIPGAADISGILHGGRRLEIECKSDTGRLSPLQYRFRRVIQHHSGLYILARSVDDVLRELPACPTT